MFGLKLEPSVQAEAPLHPSRMQTPINRCQILMTSKLCFISGFLQDVT